MKFSPRPTPMSDLMHRIKVLELQVEYLKAVCEIERRTMQQQMWDACALANNDIFGMSVGRTKRWNDRLHYYMDEFFKMAGDEFNRKEDYKGNITVEGDEDLTATRDQIDRRIKLIVPPADFADFETRYHWKENKKIFDRFREAFRRLGVKT